MASKKLESDIAWERTISSAVFRARSSPSTAFILFAASHSRLRYLSSRADKLPLKSILNLSLSNSPTFCNAVLQNAWRKISKSPTLTLIVSCRPALLWLVIEVYDWLVVRTGMLSWVQAWKMWPMQPRGELVVRYLAAQSVTTIQNYALAVLFTVLISACAW